MGSSTVSGFSSMNTGALGRFENDDVSSRSFGMSTTFWYIKCRMPLGVDFEFVILLA